jgi:RNA polymerase sigma-70 factor, ECF subfamily
MTSRSGPSSTSAELDATARSEWGRLLALLVARTRRLDLAEDALAEAFARAAERWPVDGVPASPAGWLYTVAHRQVVGRVRAEAVAGRAAPLLAVRPSSTPPEDAGSGFPDDRLDLIVLCCHPALPIESRSALALRLVIGTTTDEIARLFLVPVPTMAARITRAKKKILAAGIPLGAPVGTELHRRLDEVCRTVYLAFTAGYTPGQGPDLLRVEVASDAVTLSGILRTVAPDAPQVRALHALLVLQHSRRDARERDGRLVTLADHDRRLWRDDEIRAGLDEASALTPATGYAEELRLQALIAAEHVRAATAAATDWAAIAAHYARLEDLTGSAIVRLNRAVAVAEVEGPDAGLSLLEAAGELLASNHRLHAVRGDLAERAGQPVAAAAAFARAVELCANDVERDHLARRLGGLEKLA